MKKAYIFLFILMFLSPSAFSDDELSKALAKASALLTNTLKERASNWVCEPSKTYGCSRVACKEFPPSVFLKIDLKLSQYSRCDKTGCDNYQMEYNNSGAYTTMELPGRGGFSKILNDGSEYVEVASLGVSTVQNYGSCKPVQ